MPTNISLTPDDIREIISSSILAEMDYGQRLAHVDGDALKQDYNPGTDFPNPEKQIDRIAAQFELPLPNQLHGKTVSQMTELVYKINSGRPKNLTFFTSGSTGIPVLSSCSFALLEQEIHALSDIFKDRQRVVSLVPRHHIYGFLFSILLPKALGISVLHKPAMPTKDLIRSLNSGDIVVAFPLLWSKLEQLKAPFTDNVYGVTSTGPCHPDIIRNLRRNGLARMTEVYGSSETGGVGYRHDPDDFYTLLPYWSNHVRGELARTFNEEESPTLYTIPDALEWNGARHFKPVKRLDNCVQVGGINVSPAKIQSMFKELPQVKECTVRLMRPEEGDRLKAFIVPDYNFDTGSLEKELRSLADSKLAPHEQPQKYTFGKALPISEMGKHTDW